VEIYLPAGFDGITESTVSENERPPIWNSISGFDFDVCIGMSFAIFILPLKFRSNRTIDGGVMTTSRFFKMAQSRKFTSGLKFSDASVITTDSLDMH